MKVYASRLLTLLLLCCQLLTSCYSYHSIVKKGEVMPTNLSAEIKPGTLYKMRLTSGEEKKMKVAQVDEKNFYGRLYTYDREGKELEDPNATLPLNQVVSLKERRQDALLTIGVVLIPLGILLFIAADSCCNFNPFPNGI